jgi:hypothetical protein
LPDDSAKQKDYANYLLGDERVNASLSRQQPNSP